MSYIALYRKWRPSVFEDVVEQEHVVRTLRYSVSTGRIAHAYLFCGTRGTGKTTMAHILSRAINCLNPNNGDPCNQCEICMEILAGSSMDILEIDAASNNSVDNVREIRDEVIYSPSRAKYKVYIIDEVHMLSTGAFNALLKTLEEPPSHVVFILATTEPHKLPATILSRCQRFDFRRISMDSIVKRLDEISAANSIKLNKDSAGLIAKLSDGALRDAISLLDQCISLGNTEITYSDVLTLVGIVNDTFISAMVDDMLNKHVTGVLDKVNKLVTDGKDIPHFISDLVLYYRNLLICSITSNPGEVIDVPREVLEVMKNQCRSYSQDEMVNVIKVLSELESSLKWATNARVMFEVTLIKLCRNTGVHADENILERLAALEKRIVSGNPTPLPLHADEPAKRLPPSVEGSSPPAEGSSPPVEANKYKSSPALKLDVATRTPESKTVYLENWPEVLNHLKSLRRMTVCSFLIDTKAISLEDNCIGIVFNEKNNFGKTIMTKAEHIEAIEEAASKVFGRQIKIKCLDEDNLKNTPVRAKAAEKDEYAEKARSLAERAGVPFEIIDE